MIQYIVGVYVYVMKEKKLPPPGTGVCMYMYVCMCRGVCVFGCRCCIGGGVYIPIKNIYKEKAIQKVKKNLYFTKRSF